MTNRLELNRRHIAMLRAVGSGRAMLTCSCEPDLEIDGCPVCDQFAAHQLASAGLIRPEFCGTVGQRAPARLTKLGSALLTGVA